MPTNYWIQQGDNYHILTDLLTGAMIDYPTIQSRDTSDDFIMLTWLNLLKLFFILIIAPIIIYSLIEVYALKSLKLAL